MNKILEFLYKKLHFIVFVILEVLAILLLVNKNDLQRSVAFRYVTTLTAWTYEKTNAITDYFGLIEVNELLVEENIRLRNENILLEAKIEVNDSILTAHHIETKVDYISAKVVYNSVYDLQNFIIIHKGEALGIEEDMGVFAPQGVVGVVQRVTENYAVVLPIINMEQVISAKIKSNGQLGIVEWPGVHPYKAKLQEIPNHIKVNVGDYIVTSGFSAIFREGVLIGVVDKASYVDNVMFCDIDINLAVDFQSLSYVTVSAFKHKNELSNLKQSIGK